MPRARPGSTERIATSSARQALSRCLEQLVDALHGFVRPDAGLIDPMTGKAAPSDHYAHTGASLALLIARGAADGAWAMPLNAWRALPPSRRGHDPFNRFLIGLMLDAVGGSSDAGRTLVADRARCTLGRVYPSNNWTLLAQLCRVLEAGEARARAAEMDGFVALLDRWTTDAGGFIDFPARAARGARVATPIAYHHKALFLTTVAAWFADDAALSCRIERMLAWSMFAWDGGVHVGGFGRSTHALYGDACLVSALVLLGYAEAPAHDTPGGRMLGGVVEGWCERIRPDGLLPLNPASARGGRSGWDDYMHLAVYNAWTAGIVAWAIDARNRRVPSPGLAPFPADITPVRRDDQAGLIRVDPGGGLAVAVSTRGQPPQGFARDRIELRYAGGVPFHATLEGRVVCPAPARVAVDGLLAEPALAGWTPVFLTGNRIFALTDFERVQTEESAERFRIVLRGRPISATRPGPGGPWSRLLAAIDWRWGGGRAGRRAALHRDALPGVEAELTLTVDHRRRCLSTVLVVSKRTPDPVMLLNPGGHALTGSGPRPGRRLGLASEGVPGGGDETRLVSAPLDSAIPDAHGWCLPRVDLPMGPWGVRLALEWTRG